MPLLRPILSLILLPAWIGFAIAFLNQLYTIDTFTTRGLILLAGAIAFTILYALGHRLRLTHTLGHELTHAFSSILFRGRVKGISASSSGGKANVTKTNFIIYLAPYFFPIYTMAVVLFSFFVDQRFTNAIFFLIGFTLAHHILLTLDSLRVEQSDLTKSGMLFSLFVVFLGNLSVITLVAGLAFDVSFLEFLKEGVYLTVDVYLLLIMSVFE